MALTTCRECGRTGVSDDWRAICPGCGAPSPGHRLINRNQRLLMVGVAALISLVGAIFAFLLVHR